MPKPWVRCHLMPKHSLRHSNHIKSAHANINIESNTYYGTLEDVYVAEELKNPDMSINAVSLGKYDEDYIRSNDYLESIPSSRSREQLTYMYPE